MTEDDYIERKKAELKRLKVMLTELQKKPSSNLYLDIDRLKEQIDDIEDELNNI